MSVIDRIVFMQLADLHISRTLMPAEGGLGWGYSPHDHRLLLPLENAIADASRRLGAQTPVPILICGDVTAGGSDNDYALSAALLHSRWEWKKWPVRWMGLGWPRELILAVPGNHDHWRSAVVPRAYSKIAPAWFKETPWVQTLCGPVGQLALEVYGIDSNSGMADSSVPVNVFAAGSVAERELQGLESLLRQPRQPSGVTVLRTLMCHHAFTSTGRFDDAWPLDEVSRDKIIELARNYGISAVLTGHIHTFHEQAWRYLRPCVTELRCATSLQAPARTGVQGFWAHCITLTGGGTSQWHAYKYQWAGVRFEVDAANPVTVL